MARLAKECHRFLVAGPFKIAVDSRWSIVVSEECAMKQEHEGPEPGPDGATGTTGLPYRMGSMWIQNRPRTLPPHKEQG